MNIFNRWHVQHEDEEYHDDGKCDQSNPVECVDAVMDSGHAVVDGATDTAGLDDRPDKLVVADVLALVLVQHLEALQGLFAAVGAEDLGHVFGCHYLVAGQRDRPPDACG